MASITFVLIETELSGGVAGAAVTGPVQMIRAGYSAALEQRLTQYWADASGGRLDVKWDPDQYRKVSQNQQQWNDLSLTDKIREVRAQAGIPDGTQIILVANMQVIPGNEATKGSAATPEGSDPYVHSTWLSPAVVAHEMGHFFQWAGTRRSGHADVARAFFRDEYADPTCLMGGEDSKLSFSDAMIPQLSIPQLGGVASIRSGPMMNPAMVDLCGWLDPAAPGVDSIDPVMLGTVNLRPWKGAPPAAGGGRDVPSVAIVDGFAPDGARIYICLREQRGWDRGFGKLYQPAFGTPVPYLCVYLSTTSGDSLLLTRQPAVPGAVCPAGQLPLEVSVVARHDDIVTLQVRRSSWRGSAPIEGVECRPGAQIAGAARGSAADLYVIDVAGHVRYNHFNGHGWEHKPWPLIDGVICDPLGGIAAVARRQGLVEVFVTDLTGTVHRRQRRDRNWSAAWEAIPGGGFDARAPLAAARLDDNASLLCGVRPDHQVSRTRIGDPGLLENWVTAPAFDAGRIAATPARDADGRIYAVHRTNPDRSIWSTPDIANPDPDAWGIVGQFLFEDRTRSIAATLSLDSDLDLVIAGTAPFPQDPADERLTSTQWDGANWHVEHSQRVDRARDGGIAVFCRELQSFDVAYIDRDGVVQITSWSPRAEYQPPAQQYQADSTVILYAYDGAHLVRAKGGGGDGMGADGAVVGEWERLRMLDLGEHIINAGEKRRLVVFQANDGQYVGAVGGGGSHLNATATKIGPWEHFYLHELSEQFKVTVGCINEIHFWSAIGGGGAALAADKNHEKEWETFFMVKLGPA